MENSKAFQIIQPATKGHPHPHEHFDDASRLEVRLREVVRGEVRFDDASRALYATDASNYRQVPIGLVVPKDIADVVATIQVCRTFGAPVLSRGGGTSLAGQCCNVAVVLDESDEYPAIEADTADFAYARYQRMSEDVATGYDDAALDGFAAKARVWRKRGDAYIFMINGAKVRAPAAALALQSRLGITP